MNRRGFTLLEVIIALMLLSFISLFTVQSIQRALQTKTKMQKDIDKTSTLRDALRVIERDVNLAYNYRDTYTKLYNQAQDERKKLALQPKGTSPLPNPAPGPAPAPAPTPTPAPAPGAPPQIDESKFKHKEEDKIKTQFIGEPEAMDFTTLSNVRMMENSKVSSQAEIGYYIKSCRRRSTQEQSSKCLWRRISNYIHEDITKEGEHTVLLENVTEFKLRYLGPDTDGEWRDTWISNERGDDATKNKFPLAVEITVEVKDPNPEAKDKSLRMTTVAAIRNPNNPPPEQQPNNAQPVIPTK